jgi:DNA polymerase III epsilon subunit family exonuclease
MLRREEHVRIWDAELASLDFETTGLDVTRDRVIEVAVVRGRYGEAPRRWTALVDPGRPVDATEIHGITDAMVAGQPDFPALAPTLARMLRGAVLVAHNARFDVSFLNMEFARCGLWAPKSPAVDTLGLSRRVVALPSHKLAAMCTWAGIARDRAHRALDDAEATFQLAWCLLEHVDPTRRMDVPEIERLCRRPNMAELRVTAERLLDALRRGEPVTIEYMRTDAQNVRRAITVHRVRGARVEAFCHLRGEDRVFRMERISVV